MVASNQKTKKEIESAHVLKLSKLITFSARYQNPRNVKFLRADRLYFNNDETLSLVLRMIT